MKLKKLPKPIYGTEGKMAEPATEMQVKVIKKLTGKTYRNLTKGRASKIIGNSPANADVVKILKRKGYDVSKGVTLGQSQLAWREELNQMGVK